MRCQRMDVFRVQGRDESLIQPRIDLMNQFVALLLQTRNGNLGFPERVRSLLSGLSKLLRRLRDQIIMFRN